MEKFPIVTFFFQRCFERPTAVRIKKSAAEFDFELLRFTQMNTEVSFFCQTTTMMIVVSEEEDYDNDHT